MCLERQQDCSQFAIFIHRSVFAYVSASVPESDPLCREQPADLISPFKKSLFIFSFSHPIRPLFPLLYALTTKPLFHIFPSSEDNLFPFPNNTSNAYLKHIFLNVIVRKIRLV